MKKNHALVLSAVLVLALIVLGLPGRLYPYNGYKAVFLSNGQVYFGKLTWGFGSYATMTDIYYLRPGATNGGVEQLTTQGGNLDLVKLGNEIHGPTDKMSIRKNNIVFYETLTQDGRVGTAIAQYAASR
jgi:hypothetical protein